MGEQALERDLALDDEAGALLLADAGKRPRRVDGELPAEEILADVEGDGVALADEGHPPPGVGTADGGQPSLGAARAIHGRLRAIATGQLVDGLHRIDIRWSDDGEGAQLPGQGQTLG